MITPTSPPGGIPDAPPVATTPNSAQLRKDQLDRAFDGINNLVHFSCRNAVPPTGLDSTQFSELLGRLTTARELHSNGKLDKDAEVGFFTDFSALTAAFRPVTIGSLQDSLSTSESKARKYFLWGSYISKPTSIVRRFSFCSILSLIALLYAQIVWISGTTILTEFQKISNEWVKLNEDRANLPPSPEPTTDGTPIEIQPQDPETRKIKLLEQRLEDLQQKANALVKLVDKWGEVTVGAVTLADKAGNVNRPNTYADSLKTYADMKFASTGIVLNVYSTYLLPLLYGLMGACCYMLREIIREIRQKTFRADAEMSYWVRLFLGVLAGLAIGWFLRTEPDTTANTTGSLVHEHTRSILSLAPMALSFLAGYSVELLFSAMDRLVETFGSTSKQSPS